jgi:SAM-dependent methyltransferase
MAIVGGGRAERGVAFDLPQAMTALSEARASVDLDDRIDLVAGDFFTEVPPGDTVLLANVLHDWDDARAARILERCREAIEPGGRLLIVDRVLPEGDTPHHGKTVDINMLFLLGGRERTRREFADLLTAAGFELVETGNESGEVGWLHARPDPSR